MFNYLKYLRLNLKTGILPIILIFPFLLLGITSCDSPSNKNSETPVSNSISKSVNNNNLFYLILSPTNPDQVNIAYKLLVNAKENGVNGKTQIIKQNNSYTVVELCQQDQPNFIVPQLKPTDVTSLTAVTNTAQASLKEIKEGKKSCIATANSLVEISENLNAAANDPNNGKLIIFLQAPWGRDEISDETLKELTTNIEKLAQSKKVEKLIVFGINPDGADRLSQSFNSLNQGERKFESGSSLDEAINHLKMVHQQYFE